MSNKPEAITLENLDDVTGGCGKCGCGGPGGNARYAPWNPPGRNANAKSWRNWYSNTYGGYYNGSSYRSWGYSGAAAYGWGPRRWW
jgi:hypothetical protein